MLGWKGGISALLASSVGLFFVPGLWAHPLLWLEWLDWGFQALRDDFAVLWVG